MSLTIFTPVYNRAHLIARLFESLRRQKNSNFIWLIVDDGSTDNLQQVVQEFRREASFEIRYFYQENQGKHIAHNTGVAKCDTELFFCVDSDDYLVDDAVEKIYAQNRAYYSQNILGYYFRKIDTKGNISGGLFSVANGIVGLREIYYKYGFNGELAIVLKTNIIKKFSFPSYKNEKFVSEKVFYNQITSIAPMVYVDDIIYVYEYQSTGYTNNANKLLAKNPQGGAMGYLSDAIYGTNVKERSKAYAAFCAMRKVFKISNKTYPKQKVSLLVKVLALALKPHYNKLFRRIKEQYNEGQV